MTPAYPETYLPRMQAVLGDAFDYAVNVCHIPGDEFAKLLAASTVGARIERGEPLYLAGRSGIEVLLDVLRETTGAEPAVDVQVRLGRSQEYWIGWLLAYCQWRTCRSFADLFAAVSYRELEGLYPTLHEADVTKAADIVDARLRERFPETNLRRLRRARGCTQAELAREAGVGLRSLQMYEQRNKDIDKASAETVWRLARVLGCAMECLLER